MPRISSCLFSAVLTAGIGFSSMTAPAQTVLPAGNAHYAITQNGKLLGEARYAVVPVNGGNTWTSNGKMKLNSFSYSFNSTATVDAQGNLVRDQLTGSVHGDKASGSNIQFNTASDPTGRSFEIKIVADSKESSNTVDRHRNTVLVPDLDPAAYALMSHLALQQPKTAWVLIPKENGILVPAGYQTAPDGNGTFRGQNIVVKHSIVAMGEQNAIVVELFYTADGSLLEADLNAQNFYVTQDGFKLLNRPKPATPPPGEAPRQEDTAQPQQSPPPQQ